MFITNYRFFTLDFFENMLKKGWKETDFSDFFKVPLDKLPEEMRKKFGSMPTNDIYARFFTSEIENISPDVTESADSKDNSVSTSTPKTQSEELLKRIQELDIIIQSNHEILYKKIPTEAKKIALQLNTIRSQIKDLMFERHETIRYIDSLYHEKQVLSQELEDINSQFVLIYINKDGDIETDEASDILDFEGWNELFPTLLESESLEHLTIKQVKCLSKLVVLELKNTSEYQLIFEDAKLEVIYKQLLLKK